MKIKGTFRIYKNGELLCEQDNLITTGGRRAILRYLAGAIPSWGAAIAVGAGTAPPTINDTRLQFELGRSEVSISAPKYETYSIIKKATLSNAVVGRISEMAVYTATLNTATDNVDRLIASFDPRNEPLEYTDADSIVGKIGEQSLRINSGTLALNEFRSDLSVYQGDDQFSIAVDPSISTNFEIRIETNPSNYFTHNISAAAGFDIYSWSKSSFGVVGTPSWSDLSRIYIVPGGTPTIFEGLRISDTDPYDNYVMVSRALVPAEKIKQKTASEELEVEYEIGFTS